MSKETRIQSAEEQLQHLVDASDASDLAQSVRLLALYVATYKEHHGELDNELLQQQLLANTHDPVTLRIFESGLHEAISILSMIRLSSTVSEDSAEDRPRLLN